MRGFVRALWCVALLCLALPPLAAAAPKGRGVVLRCDKPYRGVEQKLAALGGHVTHRFVNLDAIAAVVPEARISELQAIAGVAKVYKDAMVLAPAPVQGVMGAPGRGA